MNLIVTKEFHTSVRRSAAASTIFLDRIILFGGIPHEDDMEATEIPESLNSDSNEISSVFFSLATTENKGQTIDSFLQFPAVSVSPLNLKNEGNLDHEYFSKLRKYYNNHHHSPTIHSEQHQDHNNNNNNNNSSIIQQNEEMFYTLQNSQQLALCNKPTDFPSIASRSPVFVLAKSSSSMDSFQWKFLPAKLQPWSRHGHFLLVDPFFPNRLRVLGGRHWHIGDEIPDKDLILEVSPENNLANWSVEKPPTGFPTSLFSAAVAETRNNNNKPTNLLEEAIVVGYTFGGMVANRTLTNSVYEISVQKTSSSFPTAWKATRLKTLGVKPPPQFKGIISLVGDDKSRLLVLDGYVGKTNVPPNVSELDLKTNTWRHICTSTPIARGVGLNFEFAEQDRQYLVIHGGQRTSDPIRRVGTFVIFDVKNEKWIGDKNAIALMMNHEGVGRRVLTFSDDIDDDDDDDPRCLVEKFRAIQNARSAHCAIVLRNYNQKAFEYYDKCEAIILAGSEERTKEMEEDGMLVLSLIEGEEHDFYDEDNEVSSINPASATETVMQTVPAPPLLVEQYQEMMRRAGDTGNGGEPIGSVMMIKFNLFGESHNALFSACAEFLANEKDELLDVFF